MSDTYTLIGQLAIRIDPALSDAAASGDFDIVMALADSFTLDEKESQAFPIGVGITTPYDIDLTAVGQPNVLFVRAANPVTVTINGADIENVTRLILHVETGINTLTITGTGLASQVRLIMGTLASGASTTIPYRAAGA